MAAKQTRPSVGQKKMPAAPKGGKGNAAFPLRPPGGSKSGAVAPSMPMPKGKPRVP